MAEHLLKLSLKNLKITEIPSGPKLASAHFAQPASASLLFADGTTVGVAKDGEGNLILHIKES